MSDLPDPMTSPECDLRGYEWMPLFGARLFNSDFEAHASDLAFRVAIRLYWECWLQVPAASLPNDDVLLCRLAGLGRDMKTWRKLRADGVLHGFILCSDDRVYHRLIADEAVKAWECRQRKDHLRDGWRERKQRQRDNNTNQDREHVPRDIVGCPAGHPLRQEPLSRGMSPRAEEVDSKTVDQEGTERLRRSATAGAAKTAGDEFSLIAVELAQGLLGCGPDRARSFLGRLLKATGDNQGLVMTKLRECQKLSPIDPPGWLIAAVANPFRPKMKQPYRNGVFTVIENDAERSGNAWPLTKQVAHGC